MNTNDVYDKSPKGQQEVNSREAGLSMMERRVLILINGEKEVGELAKLSLCDDIGAVVKRLVESGLIELVGSVSNEANVPAPETEDTVVDTVFDSVDDSGQVVSAREFMCNTLQTFGNKVRVADLHKTISETNDLAELKQMVKLWYQSISETPGGMYQADDLRKEVLDIMQREESNAA